MAAFTTNELIDKLLDNPGDEGLRAFTHAVTKYLMPSLHALNDTNGIPSDVFDSHHTAEINSAQAELDRIKALSEVECEWAAQVEHEAVKAGILVTLGEVQAGMLRLKEGQSFVQRYQAAVKTNEPALSANGEEFAQNNDVFIAVDRVGQWMEGHIANVFTKAAHAEEYYKSQLNQVDCKGPLSGEAWRKIKVDSLERSIKDRTKKLEDHRVRVAFDGKAFACIKEAMGQALTVK
jgi:hypothetical protein